MTQLTDAIQQKIAEALPALMADELKTFIQTAQANEKKLESMNSINQTLTTRIDDLNEKLLKHRDLDSKIQELASTKADLEKRELQLRMDTALNRALVAEAKADTLQGMMTTLFRNTVVNRDVIGSIPVAVDHTPANPGYGGMPSSAHVQVHPTHSNVKEENT